MQTLILFEDINKYSIFNIANAIRKYWICNIKCVFLVMCPKNTRNNLRLGCLTWKYLFNVGHEFMVFNKISTVFSHVIVLKVLCHANRNFGIIERLIKILRIFVD